MTRVLAILREYRPFHRFLWSRLGRRHRAATIGSRPTPPASPNSERGFALLLVFLMAAAIAIMLYQQMPRVAFEAQRDKEGLLVDRGQQYVRGIRNYFVKFKKYPAKIEDLESTDNLRFLRRRYVDPMTGSKDWRLIHVNAMGQLSDSLVTPLNPSGASGACGASGASGAPGASGSSSLANCMGISNANSSFTPTGGATVGATGPTGPSGPPQLNPMAMRRPSDNPIDGGPAGATNPAEVDPNDPRYWPPITLAPSGASGASGPQYPGAQPGLFPGQQFPGQLPGQPAIPGLPGSIPQQMPGQLQGQMPGQTQPQTGQMPGQMPVNPSQPGFNPQMPGQQTFPFQTQPTAAPGFPTPQGNGTTPANPITGMITNSLTNPQQSTIGTVSQNNNMMGGGLAGVATTFKGPSIRVYNKQQKYQLWEFIFDLKSLTGQQNMPQAQPQQQQQNGQPGFQNTTQTPTPGATPTQPTPNPNQ